MPDFSVFFKKSKGRPIEYKGRTLLMCDHFPLPGKEARLKYRIVSTSSVWKQGIAVATKGVLEFPGNEKFTKGWIDIWEHKVDWEGVFTCRSKDGLLDVTNVWDTGNGVVESWFYGSAMWIEEIPGGRRYHCNDGHPDENFDDIIFELTIVEESE